MKTSMQSAVLCLSPENREDDIGRVRSILCGNHCSDNIRATSGREILPGRIRSGRNPILRNRTAGRESSLRHDLSGLSLKRAGQQLSHCFVRSDQSAAATGSAKRDGIQFRWEQILLVREIVQLWRQETLGFDYRQRRRSIVRST